MMGPITQIVVLALVLAVLKFGFGVPVSIVGSLLLTLVLSGMATAAHNRTNR